MPRPSSPALALCLALLAVEGPAQAVGTVAGQRYLLRLAADQFPERKALLEGLRRRVRELRGSPDTPMILAALEASMEGIEARFRRAFAAAQATVVRRLWILPGFDIELPAGRADALAKEPGVAALEPVVEHAAHTIDATSPNNHNADWVQSTLGLTGLGVSLALVDSGIDFTCAGYSNFPHPAFDAHMTTTATRILKASDMDPQRKQPDDGSGHGTSVASIAVSSRRHWTFAFNGLPDEGFAPDASVLSYRITGLLPSTADSGFVVAAWQQVLTDAVNPAYPPIAAAVHSYAGSPSPQSAGQIAMDACTTYADVLCVTSAGNAGSFLSPTYDSQANCDGLAVGGTFTVRNKVTDTHRVWDDSSFGPLHGDPARFFPDLVAVCESISSAKQDVPTQVSRGSGTSFAAPMVAGTALVLRAADPTLTAAETKALLLNYTADIRAENVNRDRNYYGLGFLRTDYAVRGCLEGKRLSGKMLRDRTEVFRFPIRATKDRSHAATVVWLRPDPYVNAVDWANLDLFVYDGNGKRIGASESPRNLYEKVVFTPTATQDCTLEVRASALPTDECEFWLVWGTNYGGGGAPGAYRYVGTGCAGTGLDPAAGVQMPPFAQTSWGYDHTTQPFGSSPLRLQQAYDGASFPSSLLVTHLALRRDNEQEFTPGYTVDLEVRLGLTAKDPRSLSTQFAQNWLPGTEALVCQSSAFRVAGTRGLAYDPSAYEFVVPLQTPCLLKPSKEHHVLVEFRIKGSTLAPGSPPHYFDLEATRTGRYGRLVAVSSPTAASGSLDPYALMMSFVSAPFGTRSPNLQAPFAPEIGGNFDVVLRYAPAGAPGALLYGSLQQAIDLKTVGAPGCRLLCDLAAVIPIWVDAAGQAVHSLAIPNDQSLVGGTFWNQFLVVDTAANALGLTFSNGGYGLIGG